MLLMMVMTMMIIIVIRIVIIRVIDRATNTIIIINLISVSSISVVIMIINNIDVSDIAYCLLPTLLLELIVFIVCMYYLLVDSVICARIRIASFQLPGQSPHAQPYSRGRRETKTFKHNTGVGRLTRKVDGVTGTFIHV